VRCVCWIPRWRPQNCLSSRRSSLWPANSACPRSRCAGGGVGPRSMPASGPAPPTLSMPRSVSSSVRSPNYEGRGSQIRFRVFRSGARPPRDEMIAFIDTYRDQFGVELICRVLRAAITGFLTSRGYRAAKTRPPSDREIRDEQLIADLCTIHERNYSVYGVKKMHRAMKRRGYHLGREQTRRLMKKAGLRGVQRGKPVFTTIADPDAPTPADLVDRQFKPAAPNRLWVADITFVRTWQGFCYTAFVTDACTKAIKSWAVAASMRTGDLPLQAFEHAVWQVDSDLSELIHHSDRGSQYLSLAYTDRLAELGIAPSVGSRG
jgi:putative transposase